MATHKQKVQAAFANLVALIKEERKGAMHRSDYDGWLRGAQYFVDDASQCYANAQAEKSGQTATSTQEVET